MGIVPSPFDCAQVNRSLKTLELRMQQHQKNGLAVAKFLEKHPLVDKVIHPCKIFCENKCVWYDIKYHNNNKYINRFLQIFQVIRSTNWL